MITGRAFKFGDNISTDHIIPGRFVHLRSNLPELARHVLEDTDPTFAQRVQKGDFIVAGKNFGSGSSREFAPLALMKASIGGIIAVYFGRIFYRNCIAIGFPIIECKDAVNKVDEGDELEINLVTGRIKNTTKKEEYTGTKYPKEFLEIFQSGGIIPWIKKHGIANLE